MKKLVILSFLGLFLVKCVENETPPPPNILDQNTFTAVMIDVQLAEGKDTQKSYVARDKKGKVVDLYPAIFEKHNVDPEVFLATYDYYTSHPGKMEKVYEQVLDSLSKLDAVIKKESSKKQRDDNDSLRVKNEKSRDSLRVFRGLRKN